MLETGRLGDWETWRLGVLEIGRLGDLGDWEIGRLGVLVSGRHGVLAGALLFSRGGPLRLCSGQDGAGGLPSKNSGVVSIVSLRSLREIFFGFSQRTQRAQREDWLTLVVGCETWSVGTLRGL